MKAALGLFILISLMSISGCSSVTGDDLSELQSPNALVKKEAIQRISQRQPFSFPFVDTLASGTNEKRAVTIMVELMESGKESKEIELSILEALGRLGRSTEIPCFPLIGKLKDEDRQIRLQAVESLGKARCREALPALVQLLKDDKSKYCVIWALGELGDTRAIPALNPLLESDDQYARYNARRALAKIGTNKVEATSTTRGALDFSRIAFEKYQGIMLSLFKRIRGLKSTWLARPAFGLCQLDVD